MKKLIFTSAMALALAVGASAKTADELRIYINPGHGSWTPDDRPCTLVGHGAYSRTNTDTLSFFESNTNLRKGFGLLERLHSYGLKFDASLNQTGERWQIGAARDMSNNIVMSHVKCGPYHDDNGTKKQLGDAAPADLTYYNRSLSEICAEVDANNFDMFISIHSNAATEGTSTNYPLFLYRGYDDTHEVDGATAAHQKTSREMADKCWQYVFANKYGYWTYYSATNKNLRGDLSFYGSGSKSDITGAFGYLGVLKHHAPGFLCEGYFHTYQPARHRYMNWDVCRLEGNAYAHGIADYFGLTKEKTGVIYGVVRDQYEKFKDAAYTPNPTTDDLYKPLNAVKVTLFKGDKAVAEYTTDNYYNGAFVFSDVEPGDYTIVAENEEYITNEPIQVTVTECGLAQPDVFLVNKSWTPPTIVYENYPNVAVPNTYAADEYTFAQNYVDEPVAALEGKSVHRVIARDNKLYILAHDAQKAPTIVVYDGAAKAVLAEVSTAGTSGVYSGVGDIQLTADGVLVATNETINHYSDGTLEDGDVRGVNYIYRWENDENGIPTGDPVVLGQSKLSGNMYRAALGQTFAYTGTIADGKIIVPVYSTYDTQQATGHQFFFNNYVIVDGEFVTASINNKNNVREFLSKEQLGDLYNFSTSPLDDEAFICTGAKQVPAQYAFNDVDNSRVAMPAGIGEGSFTTGMFRYNGHAYMALADNSDNGNLGVKLVDITDGLNKARVISTVNTALPVAKDAAVAACMTAVKDQEENITAAYLNLYAVREGKVSRITTEGVTQPVNPNVYAYALAEPVLADGEYTLSFALTGNSENVEVVLTPADGSDNIVIPAGALEKGTNTVKVAQADLNENVDYTWAVKVQNKVIPASGEYAKYTKSLGTNIRAGVATFNDPENDAFGYMAVTYAKANGIDIYNAAGEKVADSVNKTAEALGGTAANASSPMRCAVRGSEVLMASWGDASCGVTAMNVLKPEDGIYSVFEGTKEKSGLIVNNGVNVGSGTPGVGFYEDGDNSVMYTFDEDLAGNNLLRYDIGAAKTWGNAPSANLGLKSLLANTTVSIVAVKDGFFAAQVRGAGNNTKGCPGFLYADKDGNVLFQSSDLAEYGMNSCNSGIALSADGKTFAVGEAGAIAVYDLAWEGKTPVFTFRNRFSIPSTDQASDMKFDYAGNLHYFVRNNHLRSCAIAAEQGKAVTTPAKSLYILKGSSDAVENITVDNDTDAPVIYYNLNGVRVADDNLTPGVYVRVQGSKATKVVVK